MQYLKYILLSVLYLIFHCFFLERYWVRFPTIEIRDANIPKEFDGYSIAVVTDVHYGFLDPLIWIRWSFQRLHSRNPDLIVGVGDYVKKKKFDDELKTIWPLLQTLEAKDGVLFVNGNHDHWANDTLARELLQKSNSSLEGTTKLISRQGSQIRLAGLGDFWENPISIDSVLKNLPQDLYTIVLTHNPDSVDQKHKSKVDLYISGHTHGGQVRIPIWDYAPLVPVKNRNYDLGLQTNRSGEKVFISGGMGWSILPIRFFCPAEIPILVLRSSQ